MSTSCDPSACLLRSGAGEWHSGQWQWASEASCCGFGEVGRERARALLRGRSLTFVGDSTARRWLWALVDSVGGMRRRRGHAVPDSSAAFDFKAIALNDSMLDTARAYHAGQAVLLNVRTGRWVGPRLAASAAAACSASVTALPHAYAGDIRPRAALRRASQRVDGGPAVRARDRDGAPTPVEHDAGRALPPPRRGCVATRRRREALAAVGGRAAAAGGAGGATEHAQAPGEGVRGAAAPPTLASG